jgi:CPA2 family monovalent cation:H+ antiporter-2
MASPLLVELGIGLMALAIAGAAARWIGLSVIPAYIVVGILIGPNTPTDMLGLQTALVSASEVIDVLAELGIVFLLFFLGLEFSVDQLLADRDRLVAVGTLDFVFNFGVGVAIGYAVGGTLLETVFVAGIVYISSSAIVTKSLIDQGWVANPESGPILGTLVFEDILIAVYLALLSAVTFGGGSLSAAGFAIGKAFLFLGALTVIAYLGADAIDRVFAAESNELFLLRVVGITVLIAGAALLTGVSEAVAAFFVGTAFSQTGHTDRIETILSPIRDLFAAVFFFAIGLTIDITVLGSILGLLALAVVLSSVSKLASGTLSGWVYGFDATRSLRVGLGLLPRGEFSLVIAALAAGTAGGQLQATIPAFAVGYVLVMSILGTVLIQQADPITSRVAPLLDRGAEPE